MSGRIYLGELEELILLMVALIGADAYGVSITKELEEQTGRVITISAAHIDIQWWLFAVPGVLVLAIALAVVCMKSFNAAMANPVDKLRNE